jgi:transposase
VLTPFGGHPDRLGVARRERMHSLGAKRKSYTPKFRAEAARLVIDTGRTIAEVAREIGVGEALLGRWVAVERSRMDDPPEALDADERAELSRLRREVTELRMDRAFLKKAAAFFATENSNPNGHSR